MARLFLPTRGPFDEIVEKASRYSGYSRDEIRGMRKTKDLCWVRFGVMWAMKKHTGCSSVQCARYLGDRDHTTVLSGWKRADTIREVDEHFAEYCDRYLNINGRKARADDFGFDGAAFRRKPVDSARFSANSTAEHGKNIA